jgi:hypothetical protein
MTEETPQPPGGEPPPGPPQPPESGAPQQPGWRPPTQSPWQPRQFTVTKIAIGVAAGIALFLVGSGVLLAVLLTSAPATPKQQAPQPYRKRLPWPGHDP